MTLIWGLRENSINVQNPTIPFCFAKANNAFEARHRKLAMAQCLHCAMRYVSYVYQGELGTLKDLRDCRENGLFQILVPLRYGNVVVPDFRRYLFTLVKATNESQDGLEQ